MTKEYTCELCKKEFNQKIDFTRHQNKKTPCITIDKMQELTQAKEVKTEFKTNSFYCWSWHGWHDYGFFKIL